MKKIASLPIILAGIFWGTMGLFVNRMESYGFTSMQTSSIRITTAALVFFLMIAITDAKSLKIHWKDLYLFALLGMVCVYGMSNLYFFTIVKTSLSMAAILLYTAPVWVILISTIAFHEKINVRKIVALVLAVAGCAMVSGLGQETKVVEARYIALGLLAGLTYGLYSIFGSVLLKKYNSNTVTAYAFLFAAIPSWFFSPPAFIMDVFLAGENKAEMILIMIGTGIVTAAIPFMLYTIGLKYTPAGKAAIMASVEPLVATLVGWLVYRQQASIIGVICILSAIILVNLQKKN